MNKIRKFRKESRLKQNQVAEHLGISQSQYSIIERGEYDTEKNKNEYLSLLDKLAKIFNCSVVDFLKEEDEDVEQISIDKSFKNGRITIEVEGKVSNEAVAIKLLEVAQMLLRR